MPVIRYTVGGNTNTRHMFGNVRDDWCRFIAPTER